MSETDFPALSEADELGLERPSSVYERMREDIIQGRVPADSRLKVRDLAARYSVSTNPIREALQQLRGEGFVIISPNRGARVRPIDEEFLRDTNEIELLIEPYLTRWFAEVVTNKDIERLVAIRDEIEILNFTDMARNSELDTEFHWHVYQRHPNRHILDLWWRHREILGAVTRHFPIAIGRQAAVLQEHRALIECLRGHDSRGAEAVMFAHVSGSGRHMMQQMRSWKRERADAQ